VAAVAAGDGPSLSSPSIHAQQQQQAATSTGRLSDYLTKVRRSR
jgi:hypothetical protein